MRSMLIKAALILVGIALSVGLVEEGLRLARYGKAKEFSFSRVVEYDPLLGWRHKRNASYELITSEYRVTLRYDANGMRGSNKPHAKPQNVSRIVVLGDSFVDGYTVQVQDLVTEVLQGSLGPQFDVINLGVVGYSIDQEFLLLEQEGWKYQTDLVILAFFFNDVWF